MELTSHVEQQYLYTLQSKNKSETMQELNLFSTVILVNNDINIDNSNSDNNTNDDDTNNNNNNNLKESILFAKDINEIYIEEFSLSEENNIIQGIKSNISSIPYEHNHLNEPTSITTYNGLLLIKMNHCL